MIQLPRDAEGREIPRNTEVMYDINGKKVHITSFTYKRTYGESVPMTARGFAGTQTRTRSRTHAPIAANFSRATKSLAVRS